jgi:membrane protease YdiL (CAAX protease family)
MWTGLADSLGLEPFAHVQDSASATGGMDQVAPVSHLAHALSGALFVALVIAFAPIAWRIAARIAGVELAALRHVGSVRWGFRHFAMVALVVIAMLQISVYAWPPRTEEPELAATLLRTALAEGAGGALIVLVALRLDPERWHALGIAWKGSIRGALAGWAAYAASLPAIIGLALLAYWILEQIGVPFETQLVVREFLELHDADVLLVLVLGIIVIPFLEELVFRGFVQPLVVQRTGPALGIAITAAAFGALHGASMFLPIFGLALVLGMVMQLTGRLFASWSVHALHNGLTFALLGYLRHHPEFMHAMGLLASR